VYSLQLVAYVRTNPPPKPGRQPGRTQRNRKFIEQFQHVMAETEEFELFR
jgi:hypothetical protein